jgi:4-hydroxy-3-methylbut-2-en-1-yl diphosphate reductase
VRNDICYATANRQEAVKQLAQEVDVILVVGSPTSSNCNRLVEVAKRTGVVAFLVEKPEDLDRPRCWDQNLRVGITSGASTPEDLVEAVVARLKPDRVRYVDGPEENINFVLPKVFQVVSPHG